jgi:hypothetical protein
MFFEVPSQPNFQVIHPVNLADSSINGPSTLKPQWLDLLDAVQNDQLQYQSKWVDHANKEVIEDIVPGRVPPLVVGIAYELYEGKSRQPPRIGSRVFIKGPVKAYKLSYVNDPRVLDELVNLLTVKDRAWVAYIMIRKMLGLSGPGFITPEQWWLEEGQTGKAKEYWTQYLKQVKPSMVWSPIWGFYKHRTPDGYDVE